MLPTLKGIFFWIYLLSPCALLSATLDSIPLLKEGEDFVAKAINASTNDSSIYYLHKGLEIFQVLNKKSEILDCYNRFCAAYYDNKNYLKYQEYSLQALTYAENNFSEKDDGYIHALSNRAIFFLFKEDYPKALALFKKNLDIVLRDSTNVSPIFEFNNIGFIYQHYIGDFERALQYYSKALDYTSNLSEEDQYILPAIYGNQAFCLKERQLLDSAYHTFQKALDFLERLELSQNNQQQRWYCYQNMGDICLKKGQQKKGLQYAQKALDLVESNQAIWDSQMTYNTFGQHFLLEKNYPKAIAFFKKEVALTQDHPELHKSIYATCHLAEALVKISKYQEAFDTIQNALHLLAPDFTDPDIRTNPSAGSIIHNASGLALIQTKAATFQGRYLQQKNPQDLVSALDNYQLAAQIIRIIRQTFAEEGSKNFLAKKSNLFYENAIETALALHQQTGQETYFHTAFFFAEQNKSMALLESMHQNTAIGFGDLPEEVMAQEKALRSDLNFFKKLIYLEKQKKENASAIQLKEYQTQLFEVKENYQELLDTLEQDFPKYHQLKYQPELSDIALLRQKVIGPKTALLEYFVGEKKIFIFCITEAESKAFALDKNTDLIPSFDRLRAFLSTPPEGKSYASQLDWFNQEAPKLHQLLLGSCEAMLAQKEQLIIIPDDFLNYLPFEVLTLNPGRQGYGLEQQEYLLENFHISYNFSASLLLQNHGKKYQASHSFAGFAPRFKDLKIAETRACEEGQLYRLQCNQEEVEAIKELMDGKTFIGEAASKNQLLQSSKQYNILHLATHACLDQGDPEFNRIYFTDDFLSNFELNNSSLQTNLVVLSACNTNSGTLIKGDGVMSLSKGFTLAGCPSLVSSLWAVDDCSTSDFMLNFYQQLKKGNRKDQALQIAKIEFLQNADKTVAHPYFWAPFLQYGEVDRLEFGTHWSYGKLILVWGLCLLLFYFIRRRFF